MSSPLDRLKQGELVQWALAYLAGAFVVIQLMDGLAEPLRLTETVQRAVVVLLAVGLFVTLVLAWYHGERGRQRVSGLELSILSTLLLIAGGLLALLNSRSSDVAPGPEPEAPLGTASLGPASVAVLPLTTASAGGEASDFLAEGFHNEILTQLTKIGTLEVIGRTSVARYATTDQTASEIGRDLGVANVLQGSLLRVADGLRLNMQLTEAASGRQLWAEAYTRAFTMEELFLILEDVAGQIARELQVALSPEFLEQGTGAPTDHPGAYEHYLRGQNFWALGVVDSAMAAYEQAVSLDPEFGVGWARLAHVASWWFFQRGDTRVLHRTQEALERARDLRPEAPETAVALGAYLLHVDWDLDGAAAQFDRVLQLRPNDAEAIHELSRVKTFEGSWEDAERLSRRALALDPFHAKACEFLGHILANTGRMEEAARYFDRGAALAPNDGNTTAFRNSTYVWGLGDTAAVRAFVEDGPSSLANGRRTWRARLAYLGRDLDALEHAADSVGSFGRFSWRSRIARLRNDPALSTSYADSLVALSDQALDRAVGLEANGYREVLVPFRRSILAAALALAGQEEQAILQAELARGLWPVHAIERSRVFHNIVLTYTFLGRADEALDRIEQELAIGSPLLTPWRLRADPDFDGLRDYPRFQALLEEYGGP